VIVLSRGKCSTCGSERVSVYSGQGRSYCRKCGNNWNWEVEREEILEDLRSDYESHYSDEYESGELTREQYKKIGKYTFKVIRNHFDSFEDALQTAVENSSTETETEGENK